jgi:hypothetical protein
MAPKVRRGRAQNPDTSGRSACPEGVEAWLPEWWARSRVPIIKRRGADHCNIVHNILNPALLEAGLVTAGGKPKYGLHSLRHFFASWLINRKRDGGREMPLKTAQTMLGHSSIVMTADIYGHLFPRGDDAAELAEAEKGILGWARHGTGVFATRSNEINWLGHK